jgi:uncharacterized 2Fe-2S/4Fe-4S cluster protein (DUF4445 family)
VADLERLCPGLLAVVEAMLVCACQADAASAPMVAKAVRTVFVHPGDQTVRAFPLELPEPTLADAVDDCARLERALAAQGVCGLEAPLPLLQGLGQRLRAANWQVTAIIETDNWRRPDGPPRLSELQPGTAWPPAGGVYGLAIDIGTTTVTVYLVDLCSGSRGHRRRVQRPGGCDRDVISRIIYAGLQPGLAGLGRLVRGTINLISRLVSATTQPSSHHRHGHRHNLAAPVPGRAPIIRLAPCSLAINHPSRCSAARRV